MPFSCRHVTFSRWPHLVQIQHWQRHPLLNNLWLETYIYFSPYNPCKYIQLISLHLKGIVDCMIRRLWCTCFEPIAISIVSTAVHELASVIRKLVHTKHCLCYIKQSIQTIQSFAEIVLTKLSISSITPSTVLHSTGSEMCQWLYRLYFVITLFSKYTVAFCSKTNYLAALGAFQFQPFFSLSKQTELHMAWRHIGGKSKKDNL